MNLCLDLGNTTVTIGIFVGEKLVKCMSISTTFLHSDLALFTETLHSFLPAEMSVKKIGFVSVVPDLEMILIEILEEETKVRPWLFNLGVTIPIPLKIDNPEEVGADRALGSWYAYQKYSRPLIVVDFGTATTFDVVSRAGEFLGGIIAPGINLSFTALLAKAARLPEAVDFSEMGPLIGKNSRDCLRAAYFQGTAAMVKGLTALIREEENENFLLVFTGGWLNETLFEKLALDGVYEPHLLLEGLNQLLRKNF